MKEKLVVGRGWGGRKEGSGCEYKRKTQGIRTMEQVCILTVMVNVQICTYKTTQSYTHTKCLWNQGNLKKLCGWYQCISWFCSCTVAIPGANSGGNWVEGVQYHPVHLFVIPCESRIIQNKHFKWRKQQIPNRVSMSCPAGTDMTLVPKRCPLGDGGLAWVLSSPLTLSGSLTALHEVSTPIPM